MGLKPGGPAGHSRILLEANIDQFILLSTLKGVHSVISLSKEWFFFSNFSCLKKFFFKALSCTSNVKNFQKIKPIIFNKVLQYL